MMQHILLELLIHGVVKSYGAPYLSEPGYRWATWLDDRSSILGKGKILYCPDRLWEPHSLLFSGYRNSFPEGKAAWV
jgi:hypothetical protein